MKKPQSRSGNLTKAEKLLQVLSDKRWHPTRELVRRVGHCFALAKFRLTGYGYCIVRERDPARIFSFRYRLKEYPDN